MTDMARGNNGYTGPKKKNFFVRLASQWQLALMSVPIFLYVLLFNYAPMWGWINAFKDYGNRKLVARGITPFNGLDNFKWLFSRPDFYQAIRNTLAMSLINLVFGTVSAIVLAILLNEVRNRGFKRTVQTVTYLPHFLSWVILGGILTNVLSLDGIVNRFIQLLGMEPVLFLASNRTFRAVIVITDVWKEFGFGSVIYLAAITGINETLYEAAEMDGANRLQRVLHVTLPGIMPTVVLMATLSLGNVLNAGFEQIFTLYNPMVYSTGDIIDTYVHRTGLVNAQYGLATAVGLLKSVVSMALIAGSYKLAEKTVNYRIF